MKAIIPLELQGDEVTMEAAEKFANYIRTATMMIPKTGNTTLTVGQITLKGDDE